MITVGARVALLQQVLVSVAATNRTIYATLQPDIPTHPIPYFGDPKQAVVATIGVNPAHAEFRGRGWPASFADAAALDARLTGYFNCSTPPYSWFQGWENVLRMFGHSYRTDAVHLDLSPRCTQNMGECDPRKFREMVASDMQWFFAVLRMCPNLKVAMMAGGVTNVYISDFLRRNIAQGYTLRIRSHLGSRQAGSGALYELGGPHGTIPVFFCGNSPSKDRGKGVALAAEVHKHLAALKAAGF